MTGASPALALVAALVFVSGCSSHSTTTSSADSVPLSKPLRAQPGSVSMSPAPGSRTASPDTQISLRGADLENATLTVTGSTSGVHSGTYRRHSDDAGMSFIPDKPFIAGETVAVQSPLPIYGSSNDMVSFTVATPAVETTPPKSQNAGAPSPPPPTTEHFATVPTIHPPQVTITTSTDPDPGYVLLTPKGGGQPSALEIVDTSGQVVWYQPAPAGKALNDLQLQSLHGQPVLTYWQGQQNSDHGYGDGDVVVLDSSYHVVQQVHAGNGYQVDLHDLQIVGDSAWFTVYTPIRWDLRPVGGPANGIVLDGVVQQVDLATGLVEFEWHSLDHIPLSESIVHPPHDTTTAWDYVHLNSVDVHSDHVLVSARHTSAVYDVDAVTGDLTWTLGGNHSDYRLPANATFAFQHDAREQADGTVTVFDDGGGPPRVEKASRALRLELDTASHTATVLSSESHTPDIVASSQGNVQQLDRGHTFVGWGSASNITEYDGSGHVVWDARLASGITSYRAYRVTWVGKPSTAPTITTSAAGGATQVSVSWNGDTRTASWRVVARSGAGTVTQRTIVRTGYETRLTLPGHPVTVTVTALDSHHHALATRTS